MRPISTPRSGRLIGFTKSQRFSRILGCDGMEPAEDEDDLSHFWWLLSLLVMKYQSSSCRSGSIPDLLAKFLALARPQPHFSCCAAATPREKPLQPQIHSQSADAV